MKEVDYSNINLGVESSPSFGQQIQLGMIERFAAILKALSNDSNTVVKIYGCVMTKTGDNYNQTAGVVYFQGHCYTVDAFNGTNASAIPVYGYNNTYTRQAWYGDSVKRDTFFTRKLNLQFGPPGSGLADYNQAVLLNDKIAEVLALSTYAKLNNPALTGIPTAPTAAPGTNTGQLATTAFVLQVRDSLVNGAPGVLDTLNEISNALGGDANLSATLTAAIASANSNANGRVSKAGDTMTGNLSIPAASAAAHAVRKDQLDAVDVSAQNAASAASSAASSANTNANGRVSKAGDTMTGALEIQGGFRTRNSGPYWDFVEYAIGAWDMDANSSAVIAHGLSGADIAKIRGADVVIYGDGSSIPSFIGIGGTNFINFDGKDQLTFGMNSTNLVLTRRDAPSNFDDTLYNDSVQNRGYVTLRLIK